MKQKRAFGKDLEEVYLKEKAKEKQKELDRKLGKKRFDKDLTDKVNENSPSKITREGDVFVITNLTLYDLEGNPARIYSEVKLDALSLMDNHYHHIGKNQDDWIEHYKNIDKKLPSLPLLYAIIEAAYDNKQDSTAQKLLKNLKTDFRPGWFVLSTRFNYSQDKIWHDVGTPEQIEITQNIPGINEFLEDLVKKQEWEKPLKSIFMTKDIQKIPQVLEVYNTRGKLWTPDSDREIERAAFAVLDDDFNFKGYYDLSVSGRFRGVQVQK